MNEQKSILRRFTGNFFRILNLSRRIIVNLVFFILLIIFIITITSDSHKVVIPEKSALVLNLHGEVVEQKHEIDPMDEFLSEAFSQQDENPEILLSDILDVIESAKSDHRIQVLVLQLQNMKGPGLTKLRDIANAIQSFKATGKQVIAVGDQYTQDQYYLASVANEIWLNPKGWLLLDGYGRYQLYFKSALDKLSISQHIFRVGTYKSAVEPYMRDDMSPAAKEANKLWLNDLWSQYKNEVASRRDFSTRNFDEDVDVLVNKLKAADGNIAQYALDNQWVDHLKTREQIKTDLIDMVGTNTANNSFNQVHFKDYLHSIKPVIPVHHPKSDKIAIIVAKGTILDGNQKPGTIGGDSTAKLLRKARENDQVKAVVLRVDSPGGSAYASEVIRQEVDLLKAAGKPVIASMGTYAASGGYWISASANRIIASPSTITGSIGIFGFIMTFENTLNRIGINTDGVGTTDIAGFGLTRPMSDGMAEIFQLSINRGYQDFITLVAQNRDMTLEEVDAIAQGRVWSGKKALELGLVDQLGDLNDAIDAAAEIAGLTNFDTLLIEKELSSKELFLRSLFGQAASILVNDEHIAAGPVQQLMTVLQKELKQLNQLNDPQGIYTLCLSCELN
ncbi:signal peptide peptidase SppA [Colwelliaceae bacterium 6471]